ncbi:hypothetical protein [Bathymodiolus thermophilus thioautotrophic gill symbiont]|nr:hypothetical protein [Bathymodiolus thermophilus thioautotrophic gill symbiont]
MPLGGVIVISVSGGFDRSEKSVVFACGGDFDSADIAVIVNIGLLGGDSC